MDQLFIIINDKAGHGHTTRLARLIKRECIKNDFPHHIEITRQASDTRVSVKQAMTQGYKIFVAVGGDGTVNTLGQELIHTDASMCIIPRGSGNGLARHLKIPHSVARSLRRIKSPKHIIIDAMDINEHLSFNVAGLGFDGYISTLFGKNGKRGAGNYMKLIQKEYLSYPDINLSIEINDKTIEKKLLQVAFANSSQYGNNAIIAPDASLTDGLVNLSMIRKVPLASLAGFFLKVFSGNIKHTKYYETRLLEKAIIRTERPVHFHTDGDGRGITDLFKIKTIPACLRLIY